MKLWLEKRGIYDPSVCLDLQLSNWLKPYRKTYYDWWWHVIQVGPICFNWNTVGKG